MKRMIFGVTVLGFVAGCAGPRMVAPADVSKGSQVLEATERSAASGALVDESFKLGGFDVADVDRDWNSSSGFGVAGYSKETTTAGYTYTLKGKGETWKGMCAAKSGKQGVALMGGGEASWGKTSITCECKNADATATVVLRDSSSGELTSGEGKYKVSAVDETDKSNFTGSPGGFRYDSDEGSIGAVEILRPGRVWLNERLPEAERLPVTCLSAGLMLYVPPKD
jgi:hypothetical protein